MSEEEKQDIIQFLRCFCKTTIDYCKLEKEDVLEILNLIDKLQKENENLNKKNKRYEKYLKNKDIEHEKVLEYIETEKERDYISKDIIRNKIKELEKQQKEKIFSINPYTEEVSYGNINNKREIEVLKELLGE